MLSQYQHQEKGGDRLYPLPLTHPNRHTSSCNVCGHKWSLGASSVFCKCSLWSPPPRRQAAAQKPPPSEISETSHWRSVQGWFLCWTFDLARMTAKLSLFAYFVLRLQNMIIVLKILETKIWYPIHAGLVQYFALLTLWSIIRTNNRPYWVYEARRTLVMTTHFYLPLYQDILDSMLS